jgi:hypothetical protein
VPLIQIILITFTSIAVVFASIAYLRHMSRFYRSHGADDEILPLHSDDHTPNDEWLDAIALTPCAVCCLPVGEDPTQRRDNRWCCQTCAEVSDETDDETFLLANAAVYGFEHGLVTPAELAEQANAIRVALRAGIDAQTRERELLAVIVGYQLVVHRLEEGGEISRRVQVALDAARAVERGMGVWEDEEALPYQAGELQ